MPSIIDNTKKIMQQLTAGDFVSGMEEFYAEDAINEEVTGAQTIGKRAIIENEHKILAGVKTFHKVIVRAVSGLETSPGNGVAFAECSIRVDMEDGSTFNPDQVQVTRWENGKAKHIKFYYDPAGL